MPFILLLVLFYHRMCARCRNEGGDVDFGALPKRKKKGRPVLIGAYVPTGEEEQLAIDTDRPVAPPVARIDTSYDMHPTVAETENLIGGEGGDIMPAPVAKSSLPKRKKKVRQVVLSAYIPTEEEERLALEMDNKVEPEVQSGTLSDGPSAGVATVKLSGDEISMVEPVEKTVINQTAPEHEKDTQLVLSNDSTVGDTPPLEKALPKYNASKNEMSNAGVKYWSSIALLSQPYFRRLPMLRVVCKVKTV